MEQVIARPEVEMVWVVGGGGHGGAGNDARSES